MNGCQRRQTLMVTDRPQNGLRKNCFIGMAIEKPVRSLLQNKKTLHHMQSFFIISGFLLILF